MRLFIRHFWEVLDVDMNESRLIILEGFLFFRRSALRRFLFPTQRCEVRYTAAAQAAVKPRTGHLRVDKLPCNSQKVVNGEQQRAAQFHNDLFLNRTQYRMSVCGRWETSSCVPWFFYLRTVARLTP